MQSAEFTFLSNKIRESLSLKHSKVKTKNLSLINALRQSTPKMKSLLRLKLIISGLLAADAVFEINHFVNEQHIIKLLKQREKENASKRALTGVCTEFVRISGFGHDGDGRYEKFDNISKTWLHTDGGSGRLEYRDGISSTILFYGVDGTCFCEEPDAIDITACYNKADVWQCLTGDNYPDAILEPGIHASALPLSAEQNVFVC